MSFLLFLKFVECFVLVLLSSTHVWVAKWSDKSNVSMLQLNVFTVYVDLQFDYRVGVHGLEKKECGSWEIKL